MNISGQIQLCEKPYCNAGDPCDFCMASEPMEDTCSVSCYDVSIS